MLVETRSEEEKIQAILDAVFGGDFEKPTPPETPLSVEMVELVEVAKRYTDREIPTIVVEPEPVFFCGRLDFHEYDRVTIRVATIHRWDLYGDGTWYDKERSDWEQLRTLAHELGHVIDGRTYEEAGLKACEDAADAWADRLLKEAGHVQGYDLGAELRAAIAKMEAN